MRGIISIIISLFFLYYLSEQRLEKKHAKTQTLLKVDTLKYDSLNNLKNGMLERNMHDK